MTNKDRDATATNQASMLTMLKARLESLEKRMVALEKQAKPEPRSDLLSWALKGWQTRRK